MSARRDFGDRLKQAREARGVSLRDIATTTKISMSALEGLEHGEGSRLPGGIFSRSFVRAYAAEVGLDPEATLRAFLELSPDDAGPARGLAAQPQATIPGTEPGGSRPGRLIAATAMLLLAAGTGVALMGWKLAGRQGTETPAVAVSAPLPVTQAPPPTPQPPSFPEPPAEATTGAATPAAPADTTPSRDLAQVVDSDRLRLSVQSTGRCWVRIVADGYVVFSREMGSGEREVREARASFVITVGNAGAFSYTINDVPGRPLGGAGKVVTVRIDRTTLQGFVAD